MVDSSEALLPTVMVTKDVLVGDQLESWSRLGAIWQTYRSLPSVLVWSSSTVKLARGATLMVFTSSGWMLVKGLKTGGYGWAGSFVYS